MGGKEVKNLYLDMAVTTGWLNATSTRGTIEPGGGFGLSKKNWLGV